MGKLFGNTGTNNFVELVFNLSYLIYLHIAHSLNLTAEGKKEVEKNLFSISPVARRTRGLKWW